MLPLNNNNVEVLLYYIVLKSAMIIWRFLSDSEVTVISLNARHKGLHMWRPCKIDIWGVLMSHTYWEDPSSQRSHLSEIVQLNFTIYDRKICLHTVNVKYDEAWHYTKSTVVELSKRKLFLPIIFYSITPLSSSTKTVLTILLCGCWKIILILSGIFFILPCIDNYARVDLRTRTYDIPPQEVTLTFIGTSIFKNMINIFL